MTRARLPILALALLPLAASAGPVWTPIENPPATSAKQLVTSSSSLIYTLDAGAAAEALADSQGAIQIPRPDGSMETFRFEESPVAAPELLAWLANEGLPVRSYRAVGEDSGDAGYIVFGGPDGFHAMIRGGEGLFLVEPMREGDATTHASYWQRDSTTRRAFACGQRKGDPPPLFPVEKGTPNRPGQLVTYRLAITTTGEFTVGKGGRAATQAGLVTDVALLNTIFEADLGVRLLLVANNNQLLFENGATDPFDAVDVIDQIDNASSAINGVIGLAAYDVGHVFSTSDQGGIASTPAVCTSRKAEGVSGQAFFISDTDFIVSIVAHEIGHQFNADHSYNSTSGNCSGQRSSISAYEPGSGSTIMSYAGVCDEADNIATWADPYFHARSIQEMSAYIASSTCEVRVPSTNSAPPVVGAGLDRTIPVGTPFELTATASDGDGDALTFCWEQFDRAPSAQGYGTPDNGSNILYRSRPPVASPSRSFPALLNVLGNDLSPSSEVLPATNRTLNFRVTARDNHPGAGISAFDDLRLTVSAASGPFRVTLPNSSGLAVDAVNVAWDVAGTNAAPVGAAQVEVMLSLDGGATFPVSSGPTPNDGAHTIAIPFNTSSSQARIKVRAVDNYFYDANDSNFSVVRGAPPIGGDAWVLY